MDSELLYAIIACIVTSIDFCLAFLIFYRKEHYDHISCRELSVLQDSATISLGGAISNEEKKTFRAMYQAADKVLYQVKEHGRNGYDVLTPKSSDQNRKSDKGEEVDQ